LTPLQAYKLYAERGPDAADEAMAIINNILNDDPFDPDALLYGASIQYDAGRFAHADLMASRCLQVDHTRSHAWDELGRARHMMQMDEEAGKCFVNSLRITGDKFLTYKNLILIHNALGRPDKALEMAELARWLANSAEDDADLNGDVAIACLKLRMWAAGWANYESMLQTGKLRGKITYFKDGQALPVWDGTPGGEVIVYGEQGIGDEILFATMTADMIAGGTLPIIHCDRRLETMFRRSLPCPVYGGRGKKLGTEWIENHNPKAAIAIGSLGKLYRRSEADFPRKPFIKADPEKRAMVRALLGQWPGRKIGIAWSAGTRKTRTADRSLTMAELEPILSLPDTTFVSLEYKGDAPADHRIKHVPFLTQSQDYDDTASLVADLDAVVCPTTSVAFLAGALGVPCHVMVPQAPTWHWCQEGDMPWFDLQVYRRAGLDWDGCVRKIVEALLA
jgi:tetratricopeptide (TPR) repeat protein